MIKILFLSILFIFGGCVSKESSLSNYNKHMIESNELKGLMHELNMVVYDKFKSELERDNTRRRYALTLADTLKQLAIKIENIPCNKLNMDEEDKQIYLKHARQLYIDSQEIYDVAQKYELEKLPLKLDNMEKNCKSCHTYFRKDR